MTVDALAEELLAASDTGAFACTCGLDLASVTIDDAYAAQDKLVALREARGETRAGYKVGCTSRGVREQFGLDQPVCGVLMHPAVYDHGVELPGRQFTSCAVEPEFVLRVGPTGDVWGISVGIELHNFVFRHGAPTSQELIASNAIHAGVVVGERTHALTDDELLVEGLGVWVNGELRASGIGAEIMGGPLVSLRWLRAHLAARGRALQDGDLVIPGSPTPLIPVGPGDRIEVRSTRYGAVSAVLST